MKFTRAFIKTGSLRPIGMVIKDEGNGHGLLLLPRLLSFAFPLPSPPHLFLFRFHVRFFFFLLLLQLLFVLVSLSLSLFSGLIFLFLSFSRFLFPLFPSFISVRISPPFVPFLVSVPSFLPFSKPYSFPSRLTPSRLSFSSLSPFFLPSFLPPSLHSLISSFLSSSINFPPPSLPSRPLLPTMQINVYLNHLPFIETVLLLKKKKINMTALNNRLIKPSSSRQSPKKKEKEFRIEGTQIWPRKQKRSFTSSSGRPLPDAMSLTLAPPCCLPALLIGAINSGL